MVVTCGNPEVDCGWNSFSVSWVWNFSVSFGNKKRQCPSLKSEHCLKFQRKITNTFRVHKMRTPNHLQNCKVPADLL